MPRLSLRQCAFAGAYGVGSLGLSEVHATVAAPNTASLAVLAKLGFEHVRDIDEDDGGTTRPANCITSLPVAYG
ncbi:MAG: GNAT family N-acetyltransferase [Nocardioidaceae bacterium]